MNALLMMIAVAAAIAATPAAAASSQPARLMPLSHKYSDRGAKPAVARTAAGQEVQVMALLDAAGSTRIELVIPPGAIEKVQVKVYRHDALIATDNYSKGLGGAQAALDYANLQRGDRIEVQAHVKNGRGPVAIARVTTQVRLRPDLEPGIQAPATVEYNSPFSVVGRVRETNGDVGARFDCRLFADGVQVGEIPGAWVDAGSEVACHFTPSLASLGARRLVVRADAVTPGDYDAGNNAVLADVHVVGKRFDGSFAWYQKSYNRIARRTQHWDFVPGPFEPYTDTVIWDQPFHQQTYGMRGTQSGAPGAEGRLTLRHFMDATELDPIVADLSDLEATEYPECRSRYFGIGNFVLLCMFADHWYVEAMRISTNFWIYTPNGGFEPAPEIAQGNTYRAELSYVDAANALQATRQGEIVLTSRSSGWNEPYCYYTSTADGATLGLFCHSTYIEGEEYRMASGD